MAKQKTRSFAVTTVVTDIRIDGGRLIVHAVDQGPNGETVGGHDLNVALSELPGPIRAAAAKLTEHIADWADEA